MQLKGKKRVLVHLGKNDLLVKSVLKKAWIEKDLLGAVDIISNSKLLEESESFSNYKLWHFKDQDFLDGVCFSARSKKNKFGVESIEIDFSNYHKNNRLLEGVRAKVINVGFDKSGELTLEMGFVESSETTTSIQEDFYCKKWFSYKGHFFNRVDGDEYSSTYMSCKTAEKYKIVNFNRCRQTWCKKFFEEGEGILCQIDC